ncbi:MAG: PIN domain nuclease [Acidobacteria bacterium]|nr:MAG: PIN domain nuclease [Acidobacteriota bacterium]
MKYLLDTVVWVWSVHSAERINKVGFDILESGDEEVYFSAASIWELSIKLRLGKLSLPEPPARYIPKRLGQQGIRTLSVTPTHALRVYDLPTHHHDPFDRLLIAQALTEEMVILTADRAFEKYQTQLVWCGR